MTALLWLLIALPAVTGVALLVADRRAGRAAPCVAVGCAALVLIAAVIVAFGRPASAMPFIATGPLSLRVDGLAAIVVVTVAAVSLLVLVFSAADIHSSRARFFGMMLLFVAAVVLTVVAESLTALLAAWEVMGATSYALIGFHYREDVRVASGLTAFLTTRTADVGLYLAAGAALAGGQGLGLRQLPALPSPWLHLAAGGVLVAALGKAAQLPFSFWLSRAMHGPSPVSALLHSAAMVAMGGYLLLRLHPLLAASGWAAPAAAWSGAATTVLLGAVALAQTDLKQLLAASTSAQLGYVVLAAGVTAGGGAVAGGTAHLVAHAATKALLFLCAGAWLSALGTKQLPALTGAGRRYRLVGVVFAIGCVALAGIPPLSMWASKDAVLAGARAQSLPLYAVALAGAVLSAAYSGRAVGMLLRPEPRGVAAGFDTEQPGNRHVGRLEKLPLPALAAAAAALSVLELPPVATELRRAVGEARSGSASWPGMLLSGLLAAIVLALTVWLAPRLPAPVWARSWLGLEAAAHALVVRPTLRLAGALARVDDGLLDRAVLAGAPGMRRLATGAARVDDSGVDRVVGALVAGVRRLATGAARVDDFGVDRVVGALAAGLRRTGEWARRPQTGLVHQYYAQAVVGLAAALVLLLALR